MRQPALAVATIALLLLSVTPAIASYGAIDQSSNRMAQQFTEDLLRPLEPDALLLSGGDQGVGVLYVQAAENFRPDVRAIYVGSLAAPWYVSELRRRYPDVVIPFDSYVRGSGDGLASLVAANLGRMPVYLLGQAPEDLGAYDQLQAGFARQLVPKGSGGDSFAFVRDHREVIAAYQFPGRSYPSTTWEAWMSDRYSDVAFDLANALETVDLEEAKRWYREAIRIAPERSGSYRNLAILLSADAFAFAESADLFERYLQLEPNVGDADAIRAEIARLRGAIP